MKKSVENKPESVPYHRLRYALINKLLDAYDRLRLLRWRFGALKGRSASWFQHKLSKTRAGRGILFLLFLEEQPLHFVWNPNPANFAFAVPSFMVFGIISAVVSFLWNPIKILTPFGNLCLFTSITITGMLMLLHVLFDRQPT